MKNLLAAAGILAAAALSLPAQAADFTAQSPDIPAGTTIPAKFTLDGAHFTLKGMTCTGQSISPAISWANPPAGTKSFAITLYDPSAPTGSGFWHWLIIDIPATYTGLPQGAGNAGNKLYPAGARDMRDDFRVLGYAGPCPPHGEPTHHYEFTVFALDVAHLPDVDQNSSSAWVGGHIHGHTLAKASFSALLGR